MYRYEIVRRAIWFNTPPRIPFLQHQLPELPDDICDCWEMDRAKNGWFFDIAAEDDWGCGWEATEQKNMGQVVYHPLEDWSKLPHYSPPDPRNPFYFERLEEKLSGAEDRYTMVTSHFTLFERLHMLHGFERTLEDLYLEPENTEKVLDMILDFKIGQFEELHRRFGDRVHGVFITDDWGTQTNTFISNKLFEALFLERYRRLARAVHGFGWDIMLHSCGRVNNFIPYFIDAGIDAVNIQPSACGITDIGDNFAGRICFLTMTDYQATLPSGNQELIRSESLELVRKWSTPKGGFIALCFEDNDSLDISGESIETMLKAFAGQDDK